MLLQAKVVTGNPPQRGLRPPVDVHFSHNSSTGAAIPCAPMHHVAADACCGQQPGLLYQHAPSVSALLACTSMSLHLEGPVLGSSICLLLPGTIHNSAQGCLPLLAAGQLCL